MTAEKKVLIVSDSHGNRRPLELAVKALREVSDTGQGGKIDAVFHLGDGASDAGGLTDGLGRGLKVVAVRGNEDAPAKFPLIACVEIEGERVFMAHGHVFSIYDGMDRIIAAAQAERATIVLYGHTHKVSIKKRDRLWLVNPGSVAYPRDRAHGSCALLTLRAGMDPEFRFFEILERSAVRELKIFPVQDGPRY
jgi:putative phosphoesterase